MRNIVLVQDIEKRINLPIGNIKDCEIVSYTIDLVCDAMCFLTNNGLIYSFPISSSSNSSQRLLFSLAKDNTDESKWFNIQFISDINSFICISHSGTIIALKYDEDYSLKSSERRLASEEVGVVDGGISSACWSPDQSNVVIITNNNTVMLMSNNWEDVFEISLPDRIEKSPTNVHWCYDGELFAISSIDSSDEIARIRIYSKTLQLLSTAYSVTSPIIIRGLGSALAVAPNGSMIACSQRKSNSLTQIALFERNGLKHGEIELQLPSNAVSPTSNQSSAISWTVSSLHFDLATTVIAVTLTSSNNNNNINSSSTSMAESVAGATTTESNIGVIQLYYRNNYHWYLKQQWKESHLHCLGFDEEKADRLYMTYKNINNDSIQIRIVDFVWDACHSPDSTVNTVVVDGNKLLLTPLGLAIVPPPMSKHELTLPSTCRATWYWKSNYSSSNNSSTSIGQTEGYSSSVVEGTTRGDASTSADTTENSSRLVENDTWGLISLLDDNNIRIHISQETATCPYRHVDIDSQRIDELRYCRLRSLNALTHKQGMILYIASSSFDETSNKDNNHLIIMMLTNQFEIHKIHCVPIAGQICRLFSWPNNPSPASGNTSNHRVSYIQTNAEGDFEAWQLALTVTVAGGGTGNTFDVTYDVEKESAIPEPAYHLLTIPTRQQLQSHQPQPQPQYSICLSTKGRLYCRESLLASGVNSIDINTAMNVLLYVTVGTRPMLKFISLPFLLSMDYHAADEDHKFGWEIHEGNRPVERGSRLLATVDGEAKVVIQLPRGNLEAFEPRILLLEKAKKLIIQKEIFSCLLLLRKQRIDLNFLVDFSPQIFLDTIPNLVQKIIENNNIDYLSLLITSLEPYDVLTFKYQPLKHQLLITESQENYHHPWNERLDQKLNILCDSLQQVLLPLVKNGQSKLMQPLLYTYVKCQPPQLLAALHLIREEAVKKCCPSPSPPPSSTPETPGDSTTMNTKISPLLQTQIQSYLKYLMFLVEGPKLFEVALSDCDFELSKIIARLSQMDPKVYLPLLSQFETNRSSFLCAETGELAMRFQVNKYCKKMELACQFGIKALQIGKEEDIIRLEPLAIDIIQVIKDMKFQELLLPLINAAYHTEVKQRVSTKNKATTTTTTARCQSTAESLLSKLLWDIRQSYGLLCQSQGRYEEAITSFLLVHPPDVLSAIRAAKSSGNLLLAVTLTEKYEGTFLEGTQLSSRTLVTEIIETYRTIIEQSQGCLEDIFGYAEDSDSDATTTVNVNATVNGPTGTATATATTSPTRTSNDSGRPPATANQDRPVEIAKLCMDYCDDVEGAVEILSMSQRWSEAVTICCRKQRKDLLLEVRSVCVTAAKELLSLLLKKSLKIPQIVAQLNELWKDAPSRLSDVASTESKLQRELLSDVDQHPSSASVMDDADARSVSEFSEFSQSSQRSSSTTASRSTVGSGISAASLSSQTSTSSSASHRSRSSASTFSIQGIDHSILSRGGGGTSGSQDHVYSHSSGSSSSTAIPITEESQHMHMDGTRKKKKSKSRRHKGDGVDVWGLRKEIELTQELGGLANIEKAGRAVVDFCHALILLGGLEETVLANYLQCALDDYIKVLVENPVAEAPLYPMAWLRLKDMLAITAFQPVENVDLLVKTKHTKFRDKLVIEKNIWDNLRIKSLG